MFSCFAGVALKHVHDKVFASDSGMRRNVPKVVVAVTDGRSQDEVTKSAAKLQHAGKINTDKVLCLLGLVVLIVVWDMPFY